MSLPALLDICIVMRSSSDEIPTWIYSFAYQITFKAGYFQTVWVLFHLHSLGIIEYFTPSISEIIWVRNVRAIVVCGFLIKSLKKHILKFWKKSWVPFGRYLLNSTANPAHFHLTWAELAVLFSRQILNQSIEFKILDVRVLDKLSKYEIPH